MAVAWFAVKVRQAVVPAAPEVARYAAPVGAPLGPAVPAAERRVEGVAWWRAALPEVAVPPSVPALAAASKVRRDGARRAAALPMAAARAVQPAELAAVARPGGVLEVVGVVGVVGVGAPDVAQVEAAAEPDVARRAAEAAEPDAELAEEEAPGAAEAALVVPAARAAVAPSAAAWLSLLPWPVRPRSAATVPVTVLSPTAWW